MILLYELALWLLVLIFSPWFLYQYFVHQKHNQSLLEKLGFRFPKLDKTKGPIIWIHAVSVGETKAVASLARELKIQFPSSQLIISSITETGHAEAMRSLHFADYHVYLPFDFVCLVSYVLARAKPDLVILCESDFWFNFLRVAKEGGAKLAIVNGKISERSTHRFSSVPFFSKELFGFFDVICVQNTLYKERFAAAGAPQDKLFVTGNLKLDEEYPQLSLPEIIQWKERLGISQGQLVLTIGSTHDPEEKLFLDILQDLWVKTPDLKVLIVPRHPERFNTVAEILEKAKVRYITFTDINCVTGKEQVILIDAMGMLRMCYQLSDIGIVGGSYTQRVGGHNILEPCWYGRPVLFGPYMHTQLELVELIQRYDAGEQADATELKKYLEEWIENKEERDRIGRNGLRMIADLKGSTKRTEAYLEPLLKHLKNSH